MGTARPLALSPSLHVSLVPPPICVAMSRLTILLACVALCFVAESSAHIRSLWGGIGIGHLGGLGILGGYGLGYMPYGLGLGLGGLGGLYGGYGLGGLGIYGGYGLGGMYGGYGLGHMGGMYY